MEYEEQEVLLLLNLKEKIEQKFFTKSNLFFKMVNLETKKPFVQIGNHVFNGVYEDSLGTNLLFEEQDTPRETSIYETQTPIHLKYIGKTAKTLTLHWQKVPDEVIDVDTKELSELSFKESYDAVLNKIENGTLDINDVLKREEVNKPMLNRNLKRLEEEVKKLEEEGMETNGESSNFKVESEDPVVKPKLEKSRYEVLKEFVWKGSRAPDYYNRGNFDDFVSMQDFAILKELYLKSLDYHKISLMIDEKNVGNYVDVRASINDGVISNKDVSKLNDRDKQVLLSLNNFDNLSIPMKLILLIEHLKEEKAEILNMSEAELQVRDEYGRTVKDRYKLLKSLAKDIQYYLFVRIRENTLNAKENED